MVGASGYATEAEGAVGFGHGDSDGEAGLLDGCEGEPVTPERGRVGVLDFSADGMELGREEGEVDIAEFFAAAHGEGLGLVVGWIKEGAGAEVIKGGVTARAADREGRCAVGEGDEVIAGREIIEAVAALRVEACELAGAGLGAHRAAGGGPRNRQDVAAADGTALGIGHLSGDDGAADQADQDGSCRGVGKLSADGGAEIVLPGDFDAIFARRKSGSVEAAVAVGFEMSGKSGRAGAVDAEFGGGHGSV